MKMIHPDNDPSGLEAWAAASGLRLTQALALLATTHVNVAGGAAGLAGENWHHAVVAPHLACDAGDLSFTTALTVLMSSLHRRQDVLIGRANGFTKEELESAYHDGGFLTRSHLFLKELGNPLPAEIGIQNFSCEATLERDSEVAPQTVKLDNLLRPTVIISGVMPEKVAAVAARCHGGRPFIGGAVVNLPGGVQAREKRIEELIATAIGTPVETRLTSRSAAMNETVTARGILKISRADLERLARERMDFFGTATPVISTPPDPATVVNYVAADLFEARFLRALDHALAARRARVCLDASFSSKAAQNEFRNRDRVFRLETAALSSTIRLDGLVDLPAAMTWSLLMLARGVDLDTYVLDTVFTCAREIRDEAVRFLQAALHAAEAREWLRLAGKVAERLRRVGPCKRRTLVRGFDRQGLDLIEPVLQRLLAAGVIVQSVDLKISLGQVPVTSLSVTDVLNPHRLP